MKALPVVLALLLVSGSGVVWGNPGDAVAVRGTLAWPAILANEPFLVLRGDNGAFYYADVTAAQRRGTVALRAGSRIALVGTEGARPHELTVTALGPDDSAVSAAPPIAAPAPSTPTPSPAPSSSVSPVPGEAASPRTDSVAPPPAIEPPTSAAPLERVRGTAQSVSGHTLVVRRDDGQRVNIDVSRLDGTVARDVRAGDVVTVFGTAEAGKPFTAVGFVRTEPARSSAPSR
jgi:hypothetical protein